MKRSLMLGCVMFAAAVSQFGAQEAAASVEGKTYGVTVKTSFLTSFSDTYTFFEDGSFTSAEGGTGSWEESDFIILSVWEAQFGDGSGFEVSLRGLQLGPRLISFGSSNEGDFFVITGSQQTAGRARKTGGSYKP